MNKDNLFGNGNVRNSYPANQPNGKSKRDLMWEQKRNNFAQNAPAAQWQPPQENYQRKSESAKKRVQFVENQDPRKSEHFTKPKYFENIQPPASYHSNANGGGMQKSYSTPNIEPPATNNRIPTRLPSGGGFKASFAPSETPNSARDHRRGMEVQQAGVPNNYVDNSKLGASAARISELMNQGPSHNDNQWAIMNSDGKPHLNPPSAVVKTLIMQFPTTLTLIL